MFTDFMLEFTALSASKEVVLRKDVANGTVVDLVLSNQISDALIVVNVVIYYRHPLARIDELAFVASLLSVAEYFLRVVSCNLLISLLFLDEFHRF